MVDEEAAALVGDAESTVDEESVVAGGSADTAEVAVLPAANVDAHVPQSYANVATSPSMVAVTG